MREILFRGKRKDNGEWVYGYPIIIHKEVLDILGYPKKDIEDKYITKETYYIYNTESENKGKVKDTWIEVILETVGQYTGIKDKNGNKIFEGDYITFHTSYESDNDDYYYEDKPYLVEWCKTYAGFMPFHLNGRTRCDIVNIKVVGNKFDNPKLLKKE